MLVAGVWKKMPTGRKASRQPASAAGKLDEGLAEFQKAYATDPSISIAEQEIRRTREMIDKEKKKPAGQASGTDDRGGQRCHFVTARRETAEF